ncbi:MAG: alanine:cation symporter family protein [Lachnospiraceae bacterium]|nr:alanine:cation symporter family protein [Lachnospiraceae bacterium]
MYLSNLLDTIAEINGKISDVVWVKVGLILLIGTGMLMTVRTGFFQFTNIKEWWSMTVGGVFKKSSSAKENSDQGAISQFQALCTALAATIGTGNIAGVSCAICIGGPGAVFWMWVAAILGMATSFSENILGVYYRRKNADGEWSGGAMYYLKDGLGSKKGCKMIGKILAVLFACFTVLASFGIGNMAQVNTIVKNIESAFFQKYSANYAFGEISYTKLILGAALMMIGGVIILGGLKRIASVTENIVPFMAGAYVLGALVTVVLHIDQIGAVFAAIFKFAFGVRAVGGAAVGITMKEVFIQGCKRGVFSNEAGLGSSVLVNSNSNVKEPVRQGMWGIFEVFADTIVVCTMTAMVVLSSGIIDLKTGFPVEGTVPETVVAQVFKGSFGKAGEAFIAISILLFAFTTVLAWSHYGAKAIEYLLGVKAVKVYRFIFVVMIFGASTLTSSLAWDISDTFNGLMMIPNLIAVIVLSPVVVKITRNYLDRHRCGKNIEPLLSYEQSEKK